MRERVRDVERLKHILEAIDGIQKNQKIYSLDDIEANSIIFYGYVKYLEIIGEAVYMLTKDFRNAHPEVEWDVIEKMRHVLVHGYYHIMPNQLWSTIENDIPQLKPLIEGLYFKECANGVQCLEESSSVYGICDYEAVSLFDLVRRRGLME